MSENSRRPPWENPSLPPGGVLLAPSVQEKAPVTRHTTDFQSCQLRISPLYDGDTYVAYRLVILDPQERHIYNFDFGTDLLAEIKEWIGTMPEIGSKVQTSDQ
jgi:hypothetical protein